MKLETLISASMAYLVFVVTSFSGGIVVDGTLDGAYGDANAVQDTQTAFGNSDLGMPDFANGSEIDAGYVVIENGFMYIMLPGNLQSNFNKTPFELKFSTL